MKTLATIALILALGSCDQREPKLSDNQIQEIRSVGRGMTESCLDKLRFGGFEAMPDRVDQCFEMKPAQRWKGLWRDDFEGSRFCPAPANECSYETSGDDIWLTFAESLPGQRKDKLGGLYAIEFIGRRTAVKGRYGHLGMSDHELVVERLISKKDVEPPPPQLTEAQVAAHLKSCAAAGQCILSGEAKALIRRQNQ